MWLDNALVVCIFSFFVTEGKAQGSGIRGNLFEYYIKASQKQTPDTRIKYDESSYASRVQRTVPEWVQFPCANRTGAGVGRSPRRPTSVHKLRPGDIDVIAAMGDSLIAGNGAMEEWAFGTIIENRGVSWCAGGEGTWRQFLTLPNILKEFNPNLTGYSTGTGEFLSRHSQLNVAFPVSSDADALKQAKILVGKMRKDRRINFEQDWKMVTVFFGANDLCSAQCFNREEGSPRRHAEKLMVALDYLQRTMPRTFVNLIPVLDSSISVRMKRSMMCRLLHGLFCSCFHQSGAVNPMEQITALARDYQKAEDALINSGRYDRKDDFTVVLQPFMKLFNAPTDPARRYDEAIDISYITHDCFHFSQKGHAMAANLLWNNLLEPVGRKSVRLLSRPMERFRCPTDAAPYLFTNVNSRKYLSGNDF